MPTPKFFKQFSKDSSKDSPDASPDTTPTIHLNKDPSKTPAVAPQIMKEAWDAAHAELPQAHGVEKFLNRVGTLIVSVPQG